MLLIDAADQFFVSLLLFRCCNQRLLLFLLSNQNYERSSMLLINTIDPERANDQPGVTD